MPRHPDSYYQRFTKPYCECDEEGHNHAKPCKSRRYILVHHKDWDRQNQDRSNLITVCSACHRKIHRSQSFYFGRTAHNTWAKQARTELQRRLLEQEMTNDEG